MQPFSQYHVYIAENVLLDSRLAVFHEEEKWLAVADLHFGFELSQRMVGNLFPLWGMQSIETRLRELLRDYQPSKLILVGDLVHDKSGANEFFSLITRLREKSDVILIGGNHDIAISRQRSNKEYSRFDLLDSFATGRFEFHHGNCERKRNGCVQIIGHFHPAATLRDGAGLRLKFPALVQETNCWILPAFSPWAAGTEWEEREPSLVWACTPQRILLIDDYAGVDCIPRHPEPPQTERGLTKGVGSLKVVRLQNGHS
jgi:putative SbcD/Mre11-related phosphoesterase